MEISHPTDAYEANPNLSFTHFFFLSVEARTTSEGAEKWANFGFTDFERIRSAHVFAISRLPGSTEVRFIWLKPDRYVLS
jgi:hypothetical protein